jgi:hypothetical protein
VWLDAPPVRQQLAGVLEHDHAIAEQAPALLGERCHHSGGFAVNGVG